MFLDWDTWIWSGWHNFDETKTYLNLKASNRAQLPFKSRPGHTVFFIAINATFVLNDRPAHSLSPLSLVMSWSKCYEIVRFYSTMQTIIFVKSINGSIFFIHHRKTHALQCHAICRTRTNSYAEIQRITNKVFSTTRFSFEINGFKSRLTTDGHAAFKPTYARRWFGFWSDARVLKVVLRDQYCFHGLAKLADVCATTTNSANN